MEFIPLPLIDRGIVMELHWEQTLSYITSVENMWVYKILEKKYLLTARSENCGLFSKIYLETEYDLELYMFILLEF
jgi:hypothetical protein